MHSRGNQIKCRQDKLVKLLFISEFTTDVRHVSNAENIVADALSRVDNIVMPISLDMQEIAKIQTSDDELQQSTSTSLKEAQKIYLIGNSIQYLL